MIIYKKYWIAYLQIFFSNLNKFFINQIFFCVIKQKKYAYYLIPKNLVNKQKYLVYFLECITLFYDSQQLTTGPLRNISFSLWLAPNPVSHVLIDDQSNMLYISATSRAILRHLPGSGSSTNKFHKHISGHNISCSNFFKFERYFPKISCDFFITGVSLFKKSLMRFAYVHRCLYWLVQISVMKEYLSNFTQQESQYWRCRTYFFALKKNMHLELYFFHYKQIEFFWLINFSFS